MLHVIAWTQTIVQYTRSTTHLATLPQTALMEAAAASLAVPASAVLSQSPTQFLSPSSTVPLSLSQSPLSQSPPSSQSPQPTAPPSSPPKQISRLLAAYQHSIERSPPPASAAGYGTLDSNGQPKRTVLSVVTSAYAAEDPSILAGGADGSAFDPLQPSRSGVKAGQPKNAEVSAATRAACLLALSMHTSLTCLAVVVAAAVVSSQEFWKVVEAYLAVPGVKEIEALAQLAWPEGEGTTDQSLCVALHVIPDGSHEHDELLLQVPNVFHDSVPLRTVHQTHSELTFDRARHQAAVDEAPPGMLQLGRWLRDDERKLCVHLHAVGLRLWLTLRRMREQLIEA